MRRSRDGRKGRDIQPETWDTSTGLDTTAPTSAASSDAAPSPRVRRRLQPGKAGEREPGADWQSAGIRPAPKGGEAVP